MDFSIKTFDAKSTVNASKTGCVVVAKEGMIEINAQGDWFLVMSKGRRYDGLPTEPDFQMMQFEKYGILVSTQTKAAAGDKSAKSLSLSELLADPNKFNQGEILWRISLPIMASVLLLLAVPLGYVNPRVGRSANLIFSLILVVLYLNMLNIAQAAVVQERSSLNMAWWPLHLFALISVFILFGWRLKVNSRAHPLVLWSKLKCSMRHARKSAI